LSRALENWVVTRYRPIRDGSTSHRRCEHALVTGQLDFERDQFFARTERFGPFPRDPAAHSRRLIADPEAIVDRQPEIADAAVGADIGRSMKDLGLGVLERVVGVWGRSGGDATCQRVARARWPWTLFSKRGDLWFVALSVEL